jgi:D-tyrosyl-tRNA(Tyr) deacylase
MRAVVQRVKEASVSIDNTVTSQIKEGLLILLGIEDTDGDEDIEWLTKKIVNLRIFDDNRGVMNLSLPETGGDIIVVSQFTLYAKTKKGNRPSYIKAAQPEVAIPLYNSFLKKIGEELGKPVGAGKFGAYMKVALINDGPVTITIDTKNRE